MKKSILKLIKILTIIISIIINSELCINRRIQKIKKKLANKQENNPILIKEIKANGYGEHLEIIKKNDKDKKNIEKIKCSEVHLKILTIRMDTNVIEIFACKEDTNEKIKKRIEEKTRISSDRFELLVGLTRKKLEEAKTLESYKNDLFNDYEGIAMRITS